MASSESSPSGRAQEGTKRGPHPLLTLAFAVPVGIYTGVLSLGAIPWLQKHILYAHKISTMLWHDVNKPDHWGFAKNQITPFTLKTADGESIYAWHILPLKLYGKHQKKLTTQPTGFCEDITKTANFKLLREDPSSRLVITLHGNAGHIAQSVRPASYHALTDTSAIHVLAIDYRGYGHSTGSPTEAGLILDATAAVDWAIKAAGIPSSQIVILGHSLGTAVASSIVESFAKRGVDFAGAILVAGFSSLPTMLAGYSIGGVLPVLAPLRANPWLLEKAMNCVVDKWLSADRLRETVKTVKERDGRLSLQLIHAENDWDIPCIEDDKLFAAAVSGLRGNDTDHEGQTQQLDHETFAKEKESRTIYSGKDAFVATWEDGNIMIRQELHPTGGHNDIMCYAPVPLAVMRAFGLLDTDLSSYTEGISASEQADAPSRN